MKKYKFIIIILFCLFLFNPNVHVSAYSYDEKEVLLNGASDFINVYKNNNNLLLIYNDKIVYEDSENDITIDGTYVCHVFSDNDLYIILKAEDTKMYKVSSFKVAKEVKLSNDLKVNKMMFLDNHLTLLGKNSVAGIINTYSTDLKEIKNNEVIKGINLDIYDCIYLDNCYYLICTKDAVVENSDFLNVGNFGEEKTVLLKLNNKMKLINTLYFNNDENKELPILFKYFNEEFYLTTKGNYLHHYKISKDLENIYFVNSVSATSAILGFNGEIINIVNIGEFSYFENFKDNVNLLEMDTLNYEIKNGCLNVYYIENDNLIEHHFVEYHIKQFNDYVITFSDNPVSFEEDLNHTKYVTIESYFSKVSVYSDNTFTTNIPGEYILDLKIIIDGYPVTKLSTKAKVVPYANVVNQGVYKTGFNLYFLGNAVLNDNIVSNGYLVNEPGEYSLEIKDKDGNKTIYKFKVVDDYYLRDQDMLYGDISVCQNDDVYASFNLKNDIRVDEVIINGEAYPFYQNNDMLKVKILGSNSYKLDNYTLEKIRVGDEYFDICYEFNVVTLKNTPTLEVVETEANFPSFKILINDFDKTIKYLKFVYNTGSECVVYNYLTKEEVSLEGLKKQSGIVTCYVCYDLGDGVIKEQKIFSLDAKYKMNNFLSVDTLINNDTLKEITISINEKGIKELHNLVCVNEKLTLNYNNKFDPTNIYISLGVSLVIICIIVVLSIIKRKKKRTKEIT